MRSAVILVGAGLLSSLVACRSGSEASKSQAASAPPPAPAPAEVASADHRMDWWREARFGMFIHWGLYAVPAGEWNGQTNYAEWIRQEARIPVGEYEKLRDKFNPQHFDPDKWVSLAKAAGMKYIVITTKHHDGFCLFDSKYTDWDVMSTPYHRDIMKQMAEACRKQGIKICWYHSIMDWHEPDYLPRREWETDRPTAGADFDRYDQHLKNQIRELLTNYGPIGVLWFDGQWEGTWTHERGLDLAAYVRKLQPNIIINNRVDKGGGQFGMTKPGYAGDYGTPEQEIPPTGFPGVDWETCMTMNDHWGYNSHDKNFKSSKDLIRKLADIASKGGNFLLNIGPTADGEFPPESVERLRDIAKWMDVNGDSIHGTQAGPFEKLEWGRCTQKNVDADGKQVTRLFLHVFDWPANRRLVVPGLFNEPIQAMVLGDKGYSPLPVTRRGADVVVYVPQSPISKIDTVVYLDIAGRPDVSVAPEIESDADIFVGQGSVKLTTKQKDVELRYTLDGTEPTAKSPVAKGPAISLARTSVVSVQSFRGDRPVSPIAKRTITKVDPWPSLNLFAPTAPGMHFAYYEGDWDRVPDFAKLPVVLTGRTMSFDRKEHKSPEHFGFRYTGYVKVPKAAAYTFWTDSDDGSNLYIDDKLVVDNDGLHSLLSKSGTAPLAAGVHSIRVDFFEKGGGHELEVWWAAPGMSKRKLPASELETEK